MEFVGHQISQWIPLKLHPAESVEGNPINGKLPTSKPSSPIEGINAGTRLPAILPKFCSTMLKLEMPKQSHCISRAKSKNQEILIPTSSHHPAPLERCVSKNRGQHQQHKDCPPIQALFSDHCPAAAASARALFSSRGRCSTKARWSTCELGLYSGTISFSCRMSCVTSRTAQICRSVSRGPVISP